MPKDNDALVVTRRQALAYLGVASALALVGCSSSSSGDSGSSGGSNGSGGSTTPASCVLTAAQIEGPYFVDERLERSDITVDPSDGSVTAGVPLRLQINVFQNDDRCAPAVGAQVDVWHASPAGVYSDETANGTAGRKYLRGFQSTDENGAVEFTTVYPGWYPGRTIHVHFKIRTFSGSTTAYEFTSQLYFDDAINDRVLAASPYNARGARDTTNAADSIYAGSTALLLALTDDGNGGYVGKFNVGIEKFPAAA